MSSTNSNRSTSRRQFLRQAGAAAGLAAVPLARPAIAQAKRDVTLRLDWVYQGPNAGFMLAQDKGYYAQAGLNVDLGPGKGSGSTAQLVASKATQFGFSDGFVVGNSVSKGMNIRTVASIYRRTRTLRRRRTSKANRSRSPPDRRSSCSGRRS
jgi:NitT/TauT family transport system substrate-binding protein